MTDNQISRPINLGIVVPCFNEEKVISETNLRLVKLLKSMSEQGLINHKSSIFYIDDGSYDGTWKLIEELASEHKEVCGIRLSRNRGHQNALLCGLMTAPGDILISIDADLQDDLNIIPQMVRHHLNGCEVVYGVRRKRDSDTFFKRITAEGFYKLMSALHVDIIFNHADYRLLSRRALNALSQYREVNLFLRGLVRQIGFKSEIVEYERMDRFSGESKYPLSKMISFAWQGVTSFTTAPLRLITTAGALVSLVSITLACWGLIASIFTDKALPGWTSTVVPMYFLGGVQLISLGVIGEYIAKIYMESKDRPRFHIDEIKGSALHDNTLSKNI
jgi:glycosyltransferase involved in cell wall biosynthesis